jgi:hypothetical protein
MDGGSSWIGLAQFRDLYSIPRETPRGIKRVVCDRQGLATTYLRTLTSAAVFHNVGLAFLFLFHTLEH